MVSPDLLDEDEDQRSLLDFARSHRPALPDFSEDESGRSEVDLDDLSARMGPSDLEDFDLDGEWGEEEEEVQWPLLLTWFNFNPSMDK